MNKKKTLIQNLTPEQTEALIKHFDAIYECNELSETEYKIIFLAWLWAKNYVKDLGDGFLIFDEAEAGVPLSDYEITFEAESSGGVNLNLMHQYYNMDDIIEILKPKNMRKRFRLEKINIDADVLPIYCPICHGSVFGDKEEIEEMNEDDPDPWDLEWDFTPCVHTLFIASDDGFLYRSTRYNKHMSFPENHDEIFYADLPEVYDGFDDLTDNISLPGAIKFAGYATHGSIYFGFAPVEDTI